MSLEKQGAAMTQSCVVPVAWIKGKKKPTKKLSKTNKKESGRVLVSQRFPWLPWVQGGAKGGSVNNVMAFIAGRVVRGVLELFAVMGGC